MSRSFSYVIHPETGESLQFQFGGDDFETFRVGDRVKSKINLSRAGEGDFLDDAYLDDDDWPRWWCVIAGGRIAAIEPALVEIPRFSPSIRIPLRGGYGQRGFYAAKHGCVPPSLDAWPIEAWAAKATGQESALRRNVAREAQYVLVDRPNALGEYTRMKMKEDGILRQIMGEPIAEEDWLTDEEEDERRNLFSSVLSPGSIDNTAIGREQRRWDYSCCGDSGDRGLKVYYLRPAALHRILTIYGDVGHKSKPAALIGWLRDAYRQKDGFAYYSRRFRLDLPPAEALTHLGTLAAQCNGEDLLDALPDTKDATPLRWNGREWEVAVG